MSDFDLSSVPTSEAEVDSLISAIESPSRVDEATEAGQGVPTPESQPPVEQPAPTPQMYKLSRKGLEKEFPIDKVVQFAQQGWDYNERMSEFNAASQKFQQEQAAHKESLARLQQYQEVENYIKGDPTWWDHVRQSYQQKLSEQGQPALPLNHPIIQQLQDKVEGIEKSFQEKEQALVQQAEDQQLDGAIASVRESYPDFDWKQTNDQGVSALEQQVLTHATQEGIGTFRAAFRDLFHNQLIKRTEVKSREALGTEIQKKTKQGIGPVTKQPVTQMKAVKNVAGLSYDEITNSALAELGIA